MVGSLNIPGAAKAATYGAGLRSGGGTPAIVLLADDREEAERMRDHLVRVGIDAVDGFIRSLDGLELVQPRLLQPEGSTASPT